MLKQTAPARGAGAVLGDYFRITGGMTTGSNLSTLCERFRSYGLAARRVAGIIRRHAGAGRLAIVVQLGIARGLTRGRALWLRLVYGLRALLVPRLLFTALISDDALVGMGHDSSRLFAVSKRLRAGASKVPTREIRLLTVR